MKKSKFLSGLLALLIAFIFTSCVSTSVSAGSSYSRRQAKETIAKTNYIISQAYEIARFYSYWERNNVSTAAYYNDYAQRLYFYHNYRQAIRYSLLAREYALDAIDGCDAYWEYFYFTYFGWSHTYGYNYNFGYSNGYRDGYYDGYYAAYCARHSHDYRKDPYHNMKPHWYNEDNYCRVMNPNNSANDRGNSHMTGGNNNGNRPGYRGEPNNRPGYKNISPEDYFTDAETTLSRDLPDRETMSSEFKRENPSVVISDDNLKSDETTIRKINQSSNSFSNKKENNNMVRQSQLKTPERVTPSTTPEVKPAAKPNKEVKPTKPNRRLGSAQKDEKRNSTVNKENNTKPRIDRRSAQKTELNKEKSSVQKAEKNNTPTNNNPTIKRR